MKKKIMEGPITPIIVKKLPDGRYLLLDDHEKLQALKELGFQTAPVMLENQDG